MTLHELFTLKASRATELLKTGQQTSLQVMQQQ